jgi:hypothetical protein
MRLALAALVFVAMLALATQASGVVETSASTSSFLVDTDSDISASRTMMESSVTTPEMNYSSNGQVDSHVLQPGGGAAIISHNIYTTARNYYGILGGGVSFSSKVTATNATSSELVMTGRSTGGVCYSQEYAMAKSETFGMGIAKVGEGGEHSFNLDGSQKTVTTRLPIPVPVMIHTDEFVNKELTVTFRQRSLEMDTPADFLQEEVNFDYRTYNNQMAYYGYDFSSFLAIEDTSCNSYMSFAHVN